MKAIWAQAHDRVIGCRGQMPWNLPEDLAFFRDTTWGHPVIMGRASWDALRVGYRPLPGRRNIVLSRTPGFEAPGAEVAESLEDALKLLEGQDVWICGGARVYAEALPLADVLVVTDIDLDVDGDARAPVIGEEWQARAVEPAEGWLVGRGGLRYRITTYERR